MANLPPALLARLQKRGIVPKLDTGKSKEQEPEEEVIAEDYDDPTSMKGATGNGKDMAPGCPNKYNIYHDCNDYCFKHWGQGETNPPPAIQRKYNRLLKKYPLPANWQQVWEPGLVRYYFWNTVSDEVSWLPPSHPDAKISLPVPKLKARLKEEEQVLQSLNSDEDDSLDDSNDSESDMSSYDSMESDDEMKKKQKTSHHRPTSPQSSNRYRGSRSKNPRNDLDPMDPASYSDSCPRGKWSDGLDAKEKTGADATATGALYQARPYPNPGSVLRMNKS